jgi:hypothetical protein
MSDFERISVSEALSRAGFDSIVDVQREALFGRHTGVPVCCECGARVEPDGHCTHDNPSVLIAKGLI